LQVQVNGESHELTPGTLLSELLNQQNLPAQRIAVELNREVVRRLLWDKTVLQEGDRIEIVHFVGGGREERESEWESGRWGEGRVGDGASE
jgi:thiamine biosynthesis protein ThiS